MRRVATDEEECTGDVYLICEMRGLCELKVNNQYLALLTFGSKASATLAANMLNIVRNAEKDEEEDHP